MARGPEEVPRAEVGGDFVRGRLRRRNDRARAGAEPEEKPRARSGDAGARGRTLPGHVAASARRINGEARGGKDARDSAQDVEEDVAGRARRGVGAAVFGSGAG